MGDIVSAGALVSDHEESSLEVNDGLGFGATVGLASGLSALLSALTMITIVLVVRYFHKRRPSSSKLTHLVGSKRDDRSIIYVPPVRINGPVDSRNEQDVDS